eukprot:sb/3464313/
MVVGKADAQARLIRTFHEFIERGEVLECERLLKKTPIDINTPLGKEKFTALHKASYYGHLDAVHWLVWHCANINSISVQGWTAAHIAALRGKEQCIEALITHGADLTIQDESGMCPVHLAAAHGNTFTLQTMARKGGDLTLRDINGWKAIHHAAYNGKLGCMQTLVKWGADLDSLTLVTGDTTLHLAAASGHLHLVKYIISTVEDWVSMLAGINNDAETALERAVVTGQDSVVDYLSNLKVNELNEFDDGFPLHVAAAKGDIPALERMIGSGLYSVNARDDHLSTPAHKAAGHGQVEALKWLILHGADVDLENGSGETVKDVAKRFAKVQCVEELGGYTEDEDEEETSPEELLARALNKVEVLEYELTDARRAVEKYGGKPPPAQPSADITAETMELRSLLEHERLKRERLEATIVELRQQVQKVASQQSPETGSPSSSPGSEAESTTSSVASSVKRRPKKKRPKKAARGVFVKNP